MTLAGDDRASAQVRGVAALKLDELKKWISMQAPSAKDYAVQAQLFFAKSQIDRFQRNPAEIHLTTPAPPRTAIRSAQTAGSELATSLH